MKNRIVDLDSLMKTLDSAKSAMESLPGFQVAVNTFEKRREDIQSVLLVGLKSMGFATTEDLNEANEKIEKLEKEIKKLKKPDVSATPEA